MFYRDIIKRLDNANPSMFESAVLKLIRKLEAENLKLRKRIESEKIVIDELIKGE